VIFGAARPGVPRPPVARTQSASTGCCRARSASVRASPASARAEGANAQPSDGLTVRAPIARPRPPRASAWVAALALLAAAAGALIAPASAAAHAYVVHSDPASRALLQRARHG